MRYICTAFLFLSFAFGFGQDTIAPKKNAKLVKENASNVTVSAEPKCGSIVFRKKIERAFRLPDVSEKTSATVIVKFVVWDDGSLRNFEIIKETPANLGLGKELIRLLMKSKRWKPGKVNGRKVKQYFTMPVSIQIMPSKKVGQEPIKNDDSIQKQD